MKFRIGEGWDVHALVPGRRLVIGGVDIPHTAGLLGHSDADVLLHALTDAVLGALAMGDIGTHFPNSDAQWKDAHSSVFLEKAVELAREKGFRVANLDSTVSLEAPKLRPYIDEIRGRIAELLGVEIGQVSVKAKTGEGVDSVGRREAIRAEAAVLLEER